MERLSPQTIVTVDDPEMRMSLTEELYRQNFTQYAPLAPFPVIRKQGAEIKHYVRPGVFYLDSIGATTPSQYLEVGESGGVSAIGQDQPFAALANAIAEASWLWDMENIDGFSLVDGFAGAQWGSAGAMMPFVTAPLYPIVQLRWHPNPHRLALYVARGDGVTPGVTLTCALMPAAGFRFRLKSHPGQYVEAWMDEGDGVQQLIARLDDPAKLPDWNRLYYVPGAPALCRFGLSLWTSAGFLNRPAEFYSWVGPVSITFNLQ